MNEIKDFILYDSLKNKKTEGEFTGSIISKCQDFIIFSDNIKISESEGISISQGLMVGFEEEDNKKNAVSKKSDFIWHDLEKSVLEYSILIPEKTMEKYDMSKFSNDFYCTINLSHTAGLYLGDAKFSIDHLNFFKDEIIKNPVSLIREGIIFADRVSIKENIEEEILERKNNYINNQDEELYPNVGISGFTLFFYDCIIVGRDQNDQLNVSYEDFINVDDKVVNYIIILGMDDLKN
jgi:hypothetical protein